MDLEKLIIPILVVFCSCCCCYITFAGILVDLKSAALKAFELEIIFLSLIFLLQKLFDHRSSITFEFRFKL